MQQEQEPSSPRTSIPRPHDVGALISESTLYELFMQAPAIVCVLRGPEHVFELVNPEYQELVRGHPLLGRSAREALSDVDRIWFDRLDRVYSTGRPYVAREARVMLDRNGDGRLEEVFFSFICQPMRSRGGKVEGIIVLAFEVTAEVRTRDNAGELFHLLVDSVEDYAIFMLDADGRITSWNPGAKRIKQYEGDEVIGRHFSMFYPQEDVRAGKPERLLSRAREYGRVEDEGWRLRKDGSRFWADAVISAVHDADGTLRGFAKVTRDMTARREAEETRRALLVAQEANRRQEEFLAMVSHELRTPLTAILGWARMLRIGGLDEATTREALDAMEHSAEAQVHLIEDLLDDARITSGRLRLNKTPLEIRSVLESALAALAPAADAKRINIVSDLGCDTCLVIGDSTRLQQVIWNVVSNAIKFTPEGGRISVQLRRNGSEVLLEVHDNGRGIDPDLLSQLFERFRQADASTARKSGLGLGLAISKYLVEQHGGRISATSEGKGKGSSFVISLPLANEESHARMQRDHDRAEELPDLSGVRVLILEDESDNAHIFATVMHGCRAEVRWTANVNEALAIVDAWLPDVIVCDLALPAMDGCEFLAKARGAWRTPALALTAFGAPEQEARVRACGFDGYRQKPIEPADLALEVARLARSSLQQQR